MSQQQLESNISKLGYKLMQSKSPNQDPKLMKQLLNSILPKQVVDKYYSQKRTFQRVQNLLKTTFYSYIGFNVISSRSRWWKLTSNMKFVCKRILLLGAISTTYILHHYISLLWELFNDLPQFSQKLTNFSNELQYETKIRRRVIFHQNINFIRKQSKIAEIKGFNLPIILLNNNITSVKYCSDYINQFRYYLQLSSDIQKIIPKKSK